MQRILDKLVDNKKIFGTTYAIKYKGEIWKGSSGNIEEDQQYFIASTTKLFTTAIIFHLQAEGKLSIDDKISDYFDDAILEGLCVYKGKDHSGMITIRHLLSHTSGIPDYFQGKDENGKSLEDELMRGKDRNWPFEEAIERSKSIKVTFAPGSRGKALYSDTNFQLLGRIIELVNKEKYASVCRDLIFSPLNLKNTYVYEDSNDKRPLNLYFKNELLIIPKAMASFGPDGGIVSTNDDMLVFIESFFSGRLFPKENLEDMKQWNKIFFPMQSGIGIHRFKLPWYFDPTGAIPEFIGHSGLSGALAFHAPDENLYVVGTVNQVASPSISFNTMIKLVRKLKSR